MQYDPIKKSLGVVFNRTPWLRKCFYRLLDILLLRTWHVKKAFRQWAVEFKGAAQLLDAGSGFGQYTYFMAKFNRKWQVKGVDVKEEQVNDCNQFFSRAGLPNAHFEVGDLSRLNESAAYDFILSVDVMEHIEEDVKVFENFHTALREKGMLLISTPSDKGGSDVHEHDHHHNDGSDSFIDEHVRDGYNIEAIQQKLKKAGFNRTEAAYAYGWPGKLSWRLSMKYPIQLLNTTRLFFILLPFYYLITFPFALLLNVLDVNIRHREGTGLIVKAWK